MTMKKSQNSSALNYQNIKKDLMDFSSQGVDIKVFKLLLALRQHLPNNNLIARRSVLNEYVSNDVFNIVSGKVIYIL